MYLIENERISGRRNSGDPPDRRSISALGPPSCWESLSDGIGFCRRSWQRHTRTAANFFKWVSTDFRNFKVGMHCWWKINMQWYAVNPKRQSGGQGTILIDSGVLESTKDHQDRLVEIHTSGVPLGVWRLQYRCFEARLSQSNGYCCFGPKTWIVEIEALRHVWRNGITPWFVPKKSLAVDTDQNVSWANTAASFSSPS